MAYFFDRAEAGRKLADALADYVTPNSIVLAVPRGGVVVGYQIAQNLNLPLDVVVPHKLGAPGNPELAIGAVAEDGTVVLDEGIVAYLSVIGDYIDEESMRQREEIGRRLKVYRKNRKAPNVRGKDVVLVDDGIATGSTMKAALASMRNRGAASVTVAVPVAPLQTVTELKKQADRVVCLYTPRFFQSIGQFYTVFAQTSDSEVVELLGRRGAPLDLAAQ